VSSASRALRALRARPIDALVRSRYFATSSPSSTS
jgi:hypothetical protein